jgi:hypothetical protein
MADTNTVVHIGENSPEQVAFKLLHEVAKAEDVTLVGTGSGRGKAPDRAWLLNTFAECLHAARGYRTFDEPPAGFRR